MMDRNCVNAKNLLKEAKKLILSSRAEDVLKGLKVLKKIINNDADNAWAFIYYGVGASKTEGHFHEAIQAFKAASDISPDSVECWKGIRACLETKDVKSPQEKELLVEAYCNLLRLEYDYEKWDCLLADIKKSAFKVSVSAVATVLSSLIEDFSSKSPKHESGCRELYALAFNDKSLFTTNMNDVFRAFVGWANFLDFADRPDFCKDVCAILTKHKYFKTLSAFLHHTLTIYGPKVYRKLNLVHYIIDIAFDSLDNIKKLIPLVRNSFLELEDVKSFPEVKLALCFVNLFDKDFTQTREYFENLSYAGDINACIFLLKFLCKAKDYESVLFLCVRFSRMFSASNNETFKYEFIMCLLESLSCSNEVTFLEYGVKFGLKALSKYGLNHKVFYNLTHSYIGLGDSNAVIYLDKLLNADSDKALYLNSLLKSKVIESLSDSDEWLSIALLSANFELINNKVKQSLKSFTKIGVKDKSVSEPFLVLGIDALSKGDTSKAASCFHRAFSLSPLNETVLKHYVDSLFKLEDEQKALQVLDSVRNGQLGKWHLIGEKALISSSLMYSAKFDHEKSIRSFKHLIKLKPDCSEFIEAITDKYIHLGRLGIAENYVFRLISNDPYNLHSLLLLSEIYKFDVDYSAYFNCSIKCVNSFPKETQESERVTKLILCFFLNFLKQNNKLEEVSLEYINKICENALYTIDRIETMGKIERSFNNEFIVALYMFIEAHLLAAVKMLYLKDKFNKVKQLFNFCIKICGRVFEIYGSSYIAFWKLLGDIFFTSSYLDCDLEVFSWLVKEDPSFDNQKLYLDVSSMDRINLSLKCYICALNSVSSCPDRLSEFYYDISVAMVHLSNHSKAANPEFRYYCLKAALESCMKSFIHSDGLSCNRWIHSNLLGVIASLLGVRDSMFKEHFSTCDFKMNEGLILQNYATHLAKTGLLNNAEETFEQARLRVDMDYPSSWTGQLLMQLINNDVETKKMLQYNLTQIGKHPLFKWIFAYFLARNRLGLSFHGGQYSILNYAFAESGVMKETNPSRLTLAAYIHDLIGNIGIARRLHFRALRLGRFISEDNYYILLRSAVRLNSNCKQNLELIEFLDSNFSSESALSLCNLDSRHLFLFRINRSILFCSLSMMKSVFNSSSHDSKEILSLILPTICNLTDLNLCRYIDVKVIFILEYLIKNIFSLFKLKKKEFRQLISAMDSYSQALAIKNIQKYIMLNNSNQSLTETKCLIPKTCLTPFVKKSISQIRMSVEENSKQCSLNSVGFRCDNDSCEGDSSTVFNTEQENTVEIQGSIHQADLCPYAHFMKNMRKTIFPLPLTDEERIVMKRNRIINLQKLQAQEQENKSFLPCEDSYLGLKDFHGCHSNCNLLLCLLQKSISAKDFDASLKYAHLCLNVRCTVCLQSSKIFPLISYVSIKTDNIRLIQKALHLYPSSPLLRKTTLLFLTRKCG